MKTTRMMKLYGTFVLSAAMLLGTLVSARAASAAMAWSCRTVTAQPTAINLNEAKAAVTFEGTAHVFYQELSTWDLKHAWRDSFHGWFVETVDGNSTGGGRTTHPVGAGVSARVAGTQMIVTYIDGSNGDVRQAVRENGAWRFEIAYDAPSLSTAAGTTAVAANAHGVLHTQGLGYGDYHQLTFRRKVTSGWQQYFVDTGVDARASITAAYFNGSLHVWYGKSDGRGGTVLAHAWTIRNTSPFVLDTRGGLVIDGWRREVLDGNGGTNGRTDSNVAGNGGMSVATLGSSQEQLHVFYSDDTRRELRHAWWTGSQWMFEALDGDRASANGRTDGETGFAPAVVNLNGVLHVFYSDLATGLRHAWSGGGQWGYEPLDGSTAAAGRCTGSTTQRVFGPTAVTAVGPQLYAFSSTTATNLSNPQLRVAEYR